MRPIARRRDKTVSHWVVVDVLHVGNEIAFVSDEVLPIATLPDRLLSPRASPWIALWQAMALCERASKRLLDEPPPGRRVEVVVGKCPDSMQMVRQYDLGFERERASTLHRLPRTFEQVDNVRVTKKRLPAIRDKREEITCAGHPDPTISHRCASPSSRRLGQAVAVGWVKRSADPTPVHINASTGSTLSHIPRVLGHRYRSTQPTSLPRCRLGQAKR
jgi:hypothetical protein